ncbi:hypothetical protein OQA88_3455 [Cercophora sp. LCS_1]
MASALLSTPARPRDDSTILISSSPDFPSITELLAKVPKKGPLRSGSNASLIPDDAIRTFTTASDVLQSSRAEDIEPLANNALPSTTKRPLTKLPEAVEPAAPKEVKEKAKRAPRKKKVAVTEDKTTDTVMNEGALAVAEKPARKRRTVKKADEQTILPKGKVTKPAKEKPAKRAETVSKHFATAAAVEAAEPKSKPKLKAAPAREQIPIDAPLFLDQATPRRRDWTPPPDIIPVAPSPAPSMPQASVAVQQDVFKNLQEMFRCSETEPERETPPIRDVLGKRKLVQMVATTASAADKPKSVEVSPVKSKAPKKKPRTITELATAAYRVPETEEPDSTKQALLNFGNDDESSSVSGAGRTKKAAKKPAKPRATKKKAEPKKQAVLSPTSAMRQVARQDFVFGTASQLATEEDPELLRAIHEAMKESNQPDDPFAGFTSSPIVTELARRRKGGALWVAGNRDKDGDLLDLQIVDLTESPPISRIVEELPALAKEQKEAPPTSQRIEIEIASSDFDSFLEAPKSHCFATQVKVTETVRPERQISPEPIQTPRNLSFDEFEPPPSNQEHHQMLVQSQANTPQKLRAEKLRAPEPKEAKPMAAPKAPDGPPRPQYELYTDAQLLKEICTYGFKVVKRRSAMIALLDQCWAAKTGTTVGSVSTHATVATSSKVAKSVPDATSPARKRGRPKKTAAAEDDAESAKNPRGRPKKTVDDAAPKPKAKSAKGKSKEPELPSTPKRKTSKPVSKPIEIPDSDSEEDPFASSPMSATDQDEAQVFSSPPQDPGDVSITEDTEMSLLVTSPTSQQKSLFSFITKAVKSAPPTTNANEPSWHEKMLMYDPIILEDLTVWLNAGQLDRVGYDGEVAPTDVKSWCESQSVCCLWRVNVNGKERKRF